MTSLTSPAPVPATPGSLRFVRAYLVTMRPYLLYISGITGIAGLALGGSLPAADATLLGGVFFVAYGFGQALTDCFQTDTDALSSPYRPLVRGEIRRRDVMAVSLAGLAVSGLVVGLYAPVNFALAGLTAAGLVTYTFFKRRWWGGPLYNAWIVAVLCLIGYAAATRGALDWSRALGGTLAAVLFGYANFVLTGYFKDVSADRQTGYFTLPVVFGWSVAALVSDVLAVLALAAAAVVLADSTAPAPWILLAAAAIAAGFGQWRLHQVRSDSAAHRAITPGLHSYVLMLAAIVVSRQPGWLFPLLLYYVAFILTLRRRPMPEQV